MTTPITSDTFPVVYKDDFKDSDNYHRILFNSARSLQARELTQMQTIIQREIQRFANNIFLDGAAVSTSSAGAKLDNNYQFIKLVEFPVGVTAESVKGLLFTGQESGVVVRVRDAIGAENGDPATIYVRYESTPDSLFLTATPSEDLVSGSITLKVASSDATGSGVKLNIAGGDFYIQGHFVFCPEQEIFLSKYTNVDVTADVGYIVTQDIVTVIDEPALFDNQGVNPNRSAPGADRYRIRMTLATKKEAEEIDAQFVSFIKVTRNEIAQLKGGNTDYNEIEKRLATRTSEESGDYLVEPFRIKFSEGDSDSVLNLRVEPFIAYVNGFRNEWLNLENIIVDKPFSVTLSDEYNPGLVSIRPEYRNYITLDSASGLDNANFSLNTRQELNLFSGAGATGSVIGTVNVQSIERVDTTDEFYFFNTIINPGFSVRDVKSIGTSATNFIVPALQDNNLFIKDASGTNTIIPLPFGRVAEVDVDNMILEVQREFNASSNGSGVITLTCSISETFEDAGDWIFINTTDNTQESVLTSSINLNTPQQATITGLTASKSYKIYTYVKKSNVSAKAKTLTETTRTATITTDSTGTYFDLNQPDIFEIISIKSSDSDGSNLSGKFILDNGQRDNYYKNGRLNLVPGSAVPNGNIFVRYKHFAREAGGDFFAVNSYDTEGLTSLVAYQNIPTYTTTSGQTIRLSDVLDFRPTMSADETFITNNVFEMPRNNTNIQLKMSNFNSRIDVLVMSQTGYLSLKKGVESLDPKRPESSSSVLPLYVIRYGARTLNSQDLRVLPIVNKRYTMRDISGLESRLDRLEDATSLSLIESQTQNLIVTDENGNIRTKSGFFVDNFESFPIGVASEFTTEYNTLTATQSVDLVASTISPRISVNNIRLLFDSDNSTNVIRKGDMIYLDYISTIDSDYIQNVISGSINVNPFNVFSGEGIVKLSPEADNWIENRRIPDNIIDGGTQLIAGNAAMNFWTFGWNGVRGNGIDPENARVGSTVNQTTVQEFSGIAGRGVLAFVAARDRNPRVRAWPIRRTTTTDRVTAVETIREVIGDRVVQTVFIPWMRNKLIYFKAQGLRPNTRYFPFFDDVNVSQWCREEQLFQTTQENDIDYGDVNPSLTQHPEGSSNLVTNNDGDLVGSFWLPNTLSQTYFPDLQTQSQANNVREAFLKLKATTISSTGGSANNSEVFDQIGWGFNVGTREFKLLDISTGIDEDSLSKARCNYVASGRINFRQRDVLSTRQVTVERTTTTTGWFDPIAQSFLVGDDKDEGIFVTSVQVYIKSAPGVADTQVPLQLQIRGVRDGTPMSGMVNQQARVYKTASQVRAEISGQDPGNLASVIAHPVTFEFEEPIFLPSNGEYAIVLLAETDLYEAYIATTYEFLLGSTEKRISKQPANGSLFLSQNGSTWTPDQNSDLAFRINVAKFKNNGVANFKNASVPRYFFARDNQLSIDSGSNKLIVLHPASGLIRGDNPRLLGLDSSETYGGILGSTIMNPSNVIDSADPFGYTILLDSSATSDDVFGPSSLSALQNFMVDRVNVNIGTIVPESTSMLYGARFVSGISYANDVNITNDDTRFDIDNNFRQIDENDNLLFTSPKMIANTFAQNSSMGGQSSMLLSAVMSSSQFSDNPVGQYVSDITPVIDLQRISAIVCNHLIDNQDSASATGIEFKNRPRDFIPETDPLSGSTLSKHITKPITLPIEAVGLKIEFNAHRPPAANFDVYFRTTSDDVDIYTIDWELLDPVQEDPTIFGTEGAISKSGYPDPNPIIEDEESMQFSDYSYFAGDYFGAGLNDLPSFTQYQLKIVFRSTNTSQIPVLNNIRVISVAV